MNELKENIVILKKKDYDKLQEDIRDLQSKLDSKEKLYNVFEKYFWDDLFENEDYDFKHIEGETLDDYCFRNLACKALEAGMTDIEYITQKIIEYSDKQKEKENE